MTDEPERNVTGPGSREAAPRAASWWAPAPPRPALPRIQPRRLYAQLEPPPSPAAWWTPKGPEAEPRLAGPASPGPDALPADAGPTRLPGWGEQPSRRPASPPAAIPSTVVPSAAVPAAPAAPSATVPPAAIPSAVAAIPAAPAARRAPPVPARRGGCSRFLFGLLLVAALGVLLLGVALMGYASIARDLPPPDELQARASQFASTLIYDRAGNVLNEVADPNYGRRTVVPIEQISQYLKDATIATEDPNFYSHPGVDPVGLGRALYYALRNRDLSGPGGSTITQQLVKLTFLSSEKTISRKVKEAILATEITRRYSRDEILQIYLNEVNYGNLAYGIEAAAETYFDKHAADLTLAESALLAGLPQAPATYDPYTRLWEADGQPGLVKRRQGVVLRLMVEREYISAEQADAAWAEPLNLQPLRQVYDSQHPHFVLYARSQVEEALGPELANKGGLRIYTTLDPLLQAAAEEQVRQQVARLADQGAHNGAVVAIRPATGEILALVGSADFHNAEISGQVNMAVSPRQPGSAIKPFVYLATFEMPAEVNVAAEAVATAQAARLASVAQPTAEGQAADPAEVSAIEPPGYWTPATAILDVRTEFPDGANPPYVPINYDEKDHGLVNVRTALGNSLNIPAVKALQHAGIDRLKDVARRAGITTLTRDDYGLSLALGGGEVTLLELTGAYATLANGGVRAELNTIACVLDSQGRLIWRGAAAQDVSGCLGAMADPALGVAITPAAPAQAFDPQHVYLVTSILADPAARSMMFGGVREMTLPDRPAAVKTGTTNDYRDAWTMGYTPDLAVGVWVGNADYTAMQRLAGSLGAAPIWQAVMLQGLHDQPARPFTTPAGMLAAPVCAESGAQPSEACPSRRDELFAANQGPLPAGYDLWQRVRVDRITGQLATEFTPEERVETRDVMVFPQRYRAWAEAHGYPVLGQQRPPLAFEPELALYGPEDGATVMGLTPVIGHVRVPEPLVWRLEYGVGPDPIGWGVLSGPNPPDPADPAGRDLDGVLGDWNVEATAAQHDTTDFSLRLAAYYDAGALDYPIAISNIVYIRIASPTATPTPTETAAPTETATPTETPWPTPTIEPTPSATPDLGPTPSAEPSPSPTPGAAASIRAAILTPEEGATVDGPVEIQGVADGPGFITYLVEFAPGAAPAAGDWQPVAEPSTQAVSGGRLATWDTTGLPPGVYTLRVQVFDVAGSSVADDVRVNVAEG